MTKPMTKKKKIYPPPGKRVLTFRVTLQHPERTLTKEEIDEAMQKVIETAREWGAEPLTTEMKEEWKKHQEEWYGKDDEEQ